MGAKKTESQKLIGLQSRRVQEVDAINDLLEQLKEHQDKLLEIDSDIMEMVNRQIHGQCRKIILPFPQIESLLCELVNDPPLLELGTSKIKHPSEQHPSTNSNKTSETKQLIIRVSETEKNRILDNIESSGYATLNEYARKMLLDGYVIQWDFAPLNELSKEMAVVSRNMSQIVKRANVTNSIYEGDFKDFNNGWKKLQTAMLSTITTMRKLIMKE